MKHFSGTAARRTRCVQAALFTVLGASALAGCSDHRTSAEPVNGRPTTPSTPSVPSAPTSTFAIVHGTVDASGQLRFDDATTVSPSTTSSASRAVYGDQNVSVKLSNTTVSIDSVTTPGTKVWSANVSLRNLLTHAIGDEQAGVSPDTMGVFVFFNTTPTITSTSATCSGCAVTITRADGTGNFTAANQQYFWWRDRVAAGATTAVAKTWSFSAPSAVTGFSFTVLVSAAWPPPDETRWKVTLNNDSLPTTQEEPPWHADSTGTGNTFTASGGVLTITTRSGTALRFYRRDSVTTLANAYIETRMQSSSANANRPENRIVIDDGVRFIALGIAKGSAWFSDSTSTFLAGTPAAVNATTGFNVYQLRKYAADSAVFYINGVRGGQIAYTALPVSEYLLTAPRLFFGNRGLAGASGGMWDYVVYEIGTPFP